jgi:hypothetical protein
MGFPTVTSITDTLVNGNSTTHNVNMPAAVTVGELLLVLFALECNAADNTLTTPGGWTLLWSSTNDAAATVRGAGYAKVAVGTEGGTTVNFVSSVATSAAAQCYRIADWFGVIATGIAVGTEAVSTGTSTPNPPSLTPPWGALDTLWIATYSAGDDGETMSSPPTNYGNQQDTVTTGGVDESAEVGSARRTLNASSENPGTFTLSASEGTVAQTIAIRPHVGLPVFQRVPNRIWRGRRR